MRYVVQQAALAFHQLREVLRHAVEIVAEIGQFVAPATHGRSHARRELAAGRRLQRPAQAADRTRHVGREQGGEDQADERAREEMHKGQFRPGRTRRRHSIAGTWWQGIRIRRTVSGDTQRRRRRRPRFMRRHRRPDRQPDTQHGRRLREEEEDQELPEQPAERQLGHGKRLTLIDEQLVAAAEHGLNARTAVRQWRQLATDAAQVDVDAAVVAFVRSPQSLL